MTDEPVRASPPEPVDQPATDVWTPDVETSTQAADPPTEVWTPIPDDAAGPDPAAGGDPTTDPGSGPPLVPPLSGAPRASYQQRPSDADPAPEPPEPLLGPPAPSPFAGLPSHPGRIVAAAFDVLAQASGDLRRASFYLGLVVLGTLAPLALLTWRVFVVLPDGVLFDPPAEPLDVPAFGSPALGLAFLLAGVVGFAGVFVASIESRAIAIAVLSARLGRRPIELRDAVQRSRRIFWRLFWAGLLAGIPLAIVQAVLQEALAGVFGSQSEAAPLTSTLVATFLFAPLAYVQVGVVIGDVGPVEAVRRSIRLFRARRTLAIVVSLFEFLSQYLTLFGLGAGLDLVVRFLDAAGLGLTGDATSTAVTVALIVVLLFALGTLILTVSAVSVAPQVVAFLALTHAAPGLDRIGHGVDRFRWLPRPTLAGMVLAAAGLALGAAALS